MQIPTAYVYNITLQYHVCNIFSFGKIWDKNNKILWENLDCINNTTQVFCRVNYYGSFFLHGYIFDCGQPTLNFKCISYMPVHVVCGKHSTKSIHIRQPILFWWAKYYLQAHRHIGVSTTIYWCMHQSVSHSGNDSCIRKTISLQIFVYIYVLIKSHMQIKESPMF